MTKPILLALLLASGTVLAGPAEESDAIPVWRVRRINAVELASHLPGELSSVTEAFNRLQDQLGRPHVKHVFFHPDPCFSHDDDDYFYWRGPRTGKRMKISREKFFEEILYPYFNAINPQGRWGS
jgi:hypothetical protein